MKSRLPRQLYLECATGDYSLLSQPNLKLVILDLNGTLVWRPSRARTNHPPKLRPGLEHFNKYLFENFAVMVWSSSSPASVSHMCNTIFSTQQQAQLVAMWARDTLGLNPRDYNRKVQTYKDLDWLWKQDQILRVKRFSQHDTVIIDDSLEKLKQHPFNLIPVPEYTGELYESGQDTTLFQVMQYLERLRYCSNVSAYLLRNKPEFAIAATLAAEQPSNLTQMDASMSPSVTTSPSVIVQEIQNVAVGKSKKSRLKAKHAPAQ